jgi:hypothetical protein
MIEVELKDLQVGKIYFIDKVKDEDTHAQIPTLRYVAVCTKDYSFSDWYEFGFDIVKGINTEDPATGLGISLEEDRWGIYKIYSANSIDRSTLISQKNKMIERAMINAVLRGITGDPKFKYY